MIHELNSTMFHPGSKHHVIHVVQAPFQLLSRHRMIAYPFETLVPSYSALNEFTEILLIGYFVYHFLNSTSYAQTSWRYVPPKFFPPVAFVGRWRPRRKDDGLVTMTWNREMKTSTKGINLFERAAKTMKTRSVFATTTSPLSPPLKSRDEISCSGGELWRPDS